jgi:hypothetical protein
VTRRGLFVAVGLAAVVALGSVAACGGSGGAQARGDDGVGIATKNVAALDAHLPTTVLGLAVAREDVSSTLKKGRRTYLDELSVYSLRSDDLLQATLQVSRLAANSDWRSAQFRRVIVEQIGGTRPREVRLDHDIVYMSAGTNQRLAVWFRGRYLFVLSTRPEFPKPQGLLRTLLETKT